MNRVKSAIAVVAVLALMPTAPAQAQLTASTSKALFYTRDVSAAAYEYCIMAGLGGGALARDIPVTRPIETSGSSTTTVASTASSKPFLGIDVGDEISVASEGSNDVRLYREVITNADDDTITVDTAWDLGTTGVNFFWRDLTCGTAVTNGIISTSGRETVTFDIQVITLAATSIDFIVEGRLQGAGTGWTPLTTAVYTAVGGGAIVVNRLGYQQLRLGVKVTGDVGTQSVTAKVVVQ